LDSAAVAANDLAHAAGIAAAADVFEQERKVESAGLVRRKFCFGGDSHSQQTAAQGVPVNRPFSKIQRVGECGDDL
jgi:hypothetical protein